MLSLGEGKATLQLREEAGCSALDLHKLPVSEARSQLQALVFGMAGRVESLERRLEGPWGGRQGVNAGEGRAAPCHPCSIVPPPRGAPSDLAQPAMGEGWAPWPCPRWLLLTGPEWAGQQTCCLPFAV